MAWSLSCTDSSRSLCVAMGAKASSVKEDKDHIKTEWALKPNTSRGRASDGMRCSYDLRRWGNSCDEVQTCMTQGGRASAGTRSQEMGYQQVWPEEAGHQQISADNQDGWYCHDAQYIHDMRWIMVQTGANIHSNIATQKSVRQCLNIRYKHNSKLHEDSSNCFWVTQNSNARLISLLILIRTLIKISERCIITSTRESRM